MDNRESQSAAKMVSIPELTDPMLAGTLKDKKVNVKGYLHSVSPNGYDSPLLDHNQGIMIRLSSPVNENELKPGKWHRLTGFLRKTKDGAYVLDEPSDIEILDQQPAPPKFEQRYQAKIKDIVDGDTVHLTDPVLGSTKVRMVSMDTPELHYYGESQGFHAEAAKRTLQDILPAQTQVHLLLGEEAFDSYGRLLAVIVKDDLNVNVELVRLGRAVPYFIYPNFKNFEAYNEAVKEATRNERGIWNPDQLIEELPYEFRFNKRGGPDKYVGNYFTKEYVPPEQWENIEIANRVFFFEEKHAKEAGYQSKN